MNQAKGSGILKSAKLGVVVIHALVTQLPEGVLQLIAAQQQLSSSFRAAAQINVQPVEVPLEGGQLQHSTKPTDYSHSPAELHACTGLLMTGKCA